MFIHGMYMYSVTFVYHLYAFVNHEIQGKWYIIHRYTNVFKWYMKNKSMMYKYTKHIGTMYK